MNNCLLVPVDGSDHSREALHTAIFLSKAYDSPKIILLQVQHSIESFHTNLFFSKEEMNVYLKENAQKILNEYISIAEAAGITYETRVKIGDPKVKIIELALEEDIKHIIMGARGLGPLTGQILGSVSYGVLHEAKYPVTIVPLNK